MSNKLTVAELAAKLTALQRALEDVTTAREMLADAEERRDRLRSDIGADHDLVRALFSNEPQPLPRRKKRGFIRVGRHIWLEPTLRTLQSAGRPVLVVELAKSLKGTEGETASNTILGSRLNRLSIEGLVIRTENGRGTKYAAKPLTPDAIIHRHRGREDSASFDHRAPAVH